MTTAPTLSMTIRFSRGRRIFSQPGVEVYGVHGDTIESVRGLIWVEADGEPPCVVESRQFRTLYPEAERRGESR